jgi:integral membrane sensor domain MASE1
VLLIVTILSSGVVASGFVGSYAVSQVVPWNGFAEAGFHFWIGDAIGTIVVLPPLLLFYERIKQRSPPVASDSEHAGRARVGADQ